MRQKTVAPSAHHESAAAGRVVWTAGERSRLIREAADMQAEYPDLAGLPLLRAAMGALAPTRRRRLLAVTQAPWFEKGVAEEIKRRTSELKASASMVPVANSFILTQKGWHDEHVAWMESTERLFRMVAQACESQLAMLSLVHRELVTLNAKLGYPVVAKMPRECECEADVSDKSGKRRTDVRGPEDTRQR